MPNAAPIVAHAVGAVRAGAIDLGAACTGFLSGLSLAAAQIETGRAERVLLIGADFTTRIVDWDDKRTAPLFGDGAGAVVRRARRPASSARSGRSCSAPTARAPSRSTSTTPTASSGWTARRSIATRWRGWRRRTVAAVDGADLALEDIDLFVYHQANGRIHAGARRKSFELAPERVVDCIENLGNSSAGDAAAGARRCRARRTAEAGRDGCC